MPIKTIFEKVYSTTGWFDPTINVGGWFDDELIIEAVSGQTVAIGQVVETDIAQPITAAGELIIAVGQVVETDLAQPITAIGGEPPIVPPAPIPVVAGGVFYRRKRVKNDDAIIAMMVLELLENDW